MSITDRCQPCVPRQAACYDLVDPAPLSDCSAYKPRLGTINIQYKALTDTLDALSKTVAMHHLHTQTLRTHQGIVAHWATLSCWPQPWLWIIIPASASMVTLKEKERKKNNELKPTIRLWVCVCFKRLFCTEVVFSLQTQAAHWQFWLQYSTNTHLWDER